ncbi:MAG: hypothetical protein MK077_06165 [Phycisphaerales bacterium]|nr:hypothetical protein [Phycisphaerales bacterium]
MTHIRTILPLLTLALTLTRVAAGVTPAWTAGEQGLGTGSGLRRVVAMAPAPAIQHARPVQA